MLEGVHSFDQIYNVVKILSMAHIRLTMGREGRTNNFDIESAPSLLSLVSGGGVPRSLSRTGKESGIRPLDV